MTSTAAHGGPDPRPEPDRSHDDGVAPVRYLADRGIRRSHRPVSSGMLRAVAQTLIAMARLDAAVSMAVSDRTQGKAGPAPETDAGPDGEWRRAVDRTRAEWAAVVSALGRGDAGDELVYVAVGGGTVIPVDINRIERLAARMERFRVIWLAHHDLADED